MSAASVLATVGPFDFGVREAATDAALLLLVGGLSMLSLIMVLVVLQSLFPDRAARGSQQSLRELQPLGGGVPAGPAKQARRSRLRRAPRARPTPAADRAIARMVKLGLGEPRLLRARQHVTTVRLYGCQGCAEPLPVAAGDQGGTGCAYELEWTREAFNATLGHPVHVREVRCARRGDMACEFEVRH
jgi:hypothetical protein